MIMAGNKENTVGYYVASVPVERVNGAYPILTTELVRNHLGLKEKHSAKVLSKKQAEEYANDDVDENNAHIIVKVKFKKTDATKSATNKHAVILSDKTTKFFTANVKPEKLSIMSASLKHADENIPDVEFHLTDNAFNKPEPSRARKLWNMVKNAFGIGVTSTAAYGGATTVGASSLTTVATTGTLGAALASPAGIVVASVAAGTAAFLGLKKLANWITQTQELTYRKKLVKAESALDKVYDKAAEQKPKLGHNHPLLKRLNAALKAANHPEFDCAGKLKSKPTENRTYADKALDRSSKVLSILKARAKAPDPTAKTKVVNEGLQKMDIMSPKSQPKVKPAKP